MTYEYNSYLAHHGIKGQKWGVRRYQNEDGTLKNSQDKGSAKQSVSDDQKNKAKAIIGFAAKVALVGLAAYGAYKVGGNLKGQMVNQALEMRKRFSDLSESYSEAERNLIRKSNLSKARAENARQLGKNEEAKLHDIARDWDQIAASKMARNSALNAEKSRHYGDIAINATRKKAVKNWIKNRGRIDINNL